MSIEPTGAELGANYKKFVGGIALGRAQTPEDMGRAVVYLCREDNITGVTINVSGGTEMG